jgi:hypothetical protein
MVAAKVAIAFLQTAVGHRPNLASSVKRRSLNQLSELVMREANQSSPENFETRVWRPSLPVITGAGAPLPPDSSATWSRSSSPVDSHPSSMRRRPAPPSMRRTAFARSLERWENPPQSVEPPQQACPCGFDHLADNRKPGVVASAWVYPDVYRSVSSANQQFRQFFSIAEVLPPDAP